jgi:hypothetical protein
MPGIYSREGLTGCLFSSAIASIGAETTAAIALVSM